MGAVQFDTGGQWQSPHIINSTTRNPCNPVTDSYDLAYLHNVVARLAAEPQTYDTTRLFFSGCSQGSGFSFYGGSCFKQHHPDVVSAFATHSTGLHYKGDGVNWSWFPPLCDECKYIPAYPQAYTDKLGLKACVFDNTEDPSAENPFFYLGSNELARVWIRLGNRAEEHYGSGGHCMISDVAYSQIVACLDDGTGRLITKASEF